MDQQIREWARRNGYQVGERGRLPGNVVDAFYLAHPWRERVVEAPVEVAETVPAPAEKVEKSGDAATALEEAIRLIAGSVAPTVTLDEDRVREIALSVAVEVMDSQPARVLEINRPGRETVAIEGSRHEKFETVLKLLAAGRNVFLVGPPGTGKSTIAQQCAEALSVPFEVLSCDPTMSGSKIWGYQDATGNYQDTGTYRTFVNGGVCCYDEIDNAHPGVTASVNSLLANGHASFPNGMQKKSDEFAFVATGNTFGTGATKQFIGRNQLDAATLDRFVTVFIDIDEKLETSLALAEIPENIQLGNEWLVNVRKWRQNAATHNLNVVISPRASINGCAVLAQGFSMDETAEMVVWKGIDKSTRAKIEGAF